MWYPFLKGRDFYGPDESTQVVLIPLFFSLGLAAARFPFPLFSLAEIARVPPGWKDSSGFCFFINLTLGLASEAVPLTLRFS